MPSPAEPPAAPSPAADPAAFIAKWSASGGAETANSQSFLRDLCDLLGVPRPDPAVPETAENRYTFERAVKQYAGEQSATNFIDLYKAGCFVLESKQGADAPAGPKPLSAEKAGGRRKSGTARRGTGTWDRAMLKARNQAERYAKLVPDWPPFLIVCDVGHCLDLYADFSGTGKHYRPFTEALPEGRSHRVRLADLADPTVRAVLKAVWTDPASLDPARRSARATRELAAKLAELAKRLEQGDSPHPARAPAEVAGFLMRCLFTMFCEDAGLLPKDSFTALLERCKTDPEVFPDAAERLWTDMDEGAKYSGVTGGRVRHFNGSLFKDRTALPLSADGVTLLWEAARADWTDVEPAIFGTLLERALDPAERHKLGAHYTPRAYVERLVLPAVVEPLREEWEAVRAAAAGQFGAGDADAARAAVRAFHERLCDLRILDPACGSGNFLYVALEHLKQLEGEVLGTLREFGEETQTLTDTVGPHNVLGIELNPRAAAIAELVVWIGYLRWHLATRGVETLPDPILSSQRTIEHRDAVLAYDARTPRLDEQGAPITTWDGRTTKPHPVTGQEVPDETARVPVYDYQNPRPAEWPQADYIVGNPPFVGNFKMRQDLGSGYVEALRGAYKALPESCDLVMYWWHLAAETVRTGGAKRFGFITTNSLRQTFNRRVVEPHLSEAKQPLSLAFAIPDHPWVDAALGADVRIAMTVGVPGEAEGQLLKIALEKGGGEEGAEVEFSARFGPIWPNLTIGPNLGAVMPLDAMAGLSSMGVKLHGKHFELSSDEYESFGKDSPFVFPYVGGRDLAQDRKARYVIDLYGLTADEARRKCPASYQHVVDNVKPHRDQNRRATYRDNWWIFGEPRSQLRKAIAGLHRVIVTARTAKHRIFQFDSAETRFESEVVTIADEDALTFGVLSSRVHTVWSLAQGGRMGIGNDPRYNNSRCFDPFPFPAATDEQAERIRDLGEQLDAHRKRVQAEHPDLTLTGMYNVLEALRAGEALTDKQRDVHDRGLVGVLRALHDDLDAAVADAYGWPVDLPDEDLLARLVVLNAERAAEEARGQIRYLRPEFQDPDGAAARAAEAKRQRSLTGEAAAPPPPAAAVRKWPPKSDPVAQYRAVRGVLAAADRPLAPADVAAFFKGAGPAKVAPVLTVLADLGHAGRTEDGRYTG
ncbi:class I SAM-dependent DNA methyltransferase [Alienimonas sp. DA493]|uniref:class I SAM-dependent DNA methyltransferase n=1 Tax=Alienimonas sp. DA493 TaxID=3373605 RepID=UPI00375423A7